uniref:CSON010283 protein n=1 Tax=Culicoides sonorensis TaxID=179676 RepID=A0A336M1I6_CULSO
MSTKKILWLKLLILVFQLFFIVDCDKRIKRQTLNFHYYNNESEKNCMNNSDDNFNSNQNELIEDDLIDPDDLFDEIIRDQKIIHVTSDELNLVIQTAQKLLKSQITKEEALIDLNLFEFKENCIENADLSSVLHQSNLVDLIYHILLMRNNVRSVDNVKFETQTSLSVEVCDVNLIKNATEIHELWRILTPYCSLHDQKLVKRLPSPRKLSLLLEKFYNNENHDTTSQLNAFGYFLFQAFTHDIAKLAPRSASGNICTKFKGCTKNGERSNAKIFLSDSVDTIDVSQADPFYGYYGKTCISANKFQIFNSNCEIRKSGLASTVNPFIDLNHIYSEATPGTDGKFIQYYWLPKIIDSNAHQTTPLQAVYILKALSHDKIAELIKSYNSSLPDTTIFEEAQRLNIFVWQNILYRKLLPKLLGNTATSHYTIDSTEDTYDGEPLNVSMEAVVAAFRYCHTFIPKKYELLKSNYDVFDEANLDVKLDPDSMRQFWQYVVRGMFSTKIPEQKKEEDLNVNGYENDLRALDIQAARDACLQPYVNYLELFYNKKLSDDWSSYNLFFSQEILKDLESVYKKTRYLDLVVGAALDFRHQSLFGDVYKIIIGRFFDDLQSSDPHFWAHELNDDQKKFFIDFDYDDWIGCIADLEFRPENLLSPLGIKNRLVSVTCDSVKTFNVSLFLSNI